MWRKIGKQLELFLLYISKNQHKSTQNKKKLIIEFFPVDSKTV
jgi:hypothetical protein